MAAGLALLLLLGLSAPAQTSGQMRPFKGIVTFFTPGDGTLTGTGNITHLGKMSVVAYEAYPGFTDEGLAIGELQGTYTAANGDTLTWVGGSLIDVSNAPYYTYEGAVEFTGGTGRFENVSGGAEFYGITEPSGTPGILMGSLVLVNGVISY